ncbi:MAG TPA: GYD domain-containing protein [Candidatus Limnocylindrales bacterium]
MPLYLTKFSYTPETWARLAKNPEDRRDAARRYIESVGGSLQGFWYAFGEYDGYTLWEAPDDKSIAAVAIALAAGGALSKCETVPLLTVDETLEALGRVGSVGYQQPGSKGG